MLYYHDKNQSIIESNARKKVFFTSKMNSQKLNIMTLACVYA